MEADEPGEEWSARGSNSTGGVATLVPAFAGSTSLGTDGTKTRGGSAEKLVLQGDDKAMCAP